MEESPLPQRARLFVIAVSKSEASGRPPPAGRSEWRRRRRGGKMIYRPLGLSREFRRKRSKCSRGAAAAGRTCKTRAPDSDIGANKRQRERGREAERERERAITAAPDSRARTMLEKSEQLTNRPTNRK